MTALTTAVRLKQPRTVKDAIAASLDNPGSRFIAGGTDLLVNMRHGHGDGGFLIDLSGIDELTAVTANGAGTTIGAGVTLAALAGNAMIALKYRALAEAAEAVAGPGHRVIGTVGGNLCLDTRCIYYNQSEWWRAANGYCLKSRGTVCHVAPQGQRCHAAYTGDLAPALLVLGAEVEIASAAGNRRVPLNELYVDDGRAHLVLKDGELIVAVHLPADPPPSTYGKVRVRGAIDYPLAGVAVALATSNAKIGTLRIALTGTNCRPVLVAGTEALAGRVVDEAALREIDKLVQKQAQPKRTTTVSANYRRVAAAGIARRLVSRLYTAATA